LNSQFYIAQKTKNEHKKTRDFSQSLAFQ